MRLAPAWAKSGPDSLFAEPRLGVLVTHRGLSLEPSQPVVYHGVSLASPLSRLSSSASIALHR